MCGDLFFHPKTNVMRGYIIKEKNHLRVVSVEPEQIIEFRRKYGYKILIAGDSIPDALRKFHELPIIFGDGV